MTNLLIPESLIIYKDYIILFLGWIIGWISYYIKNRNTRLNERKKIIKNAIRDINPIIQRLKELIASYIYIKSRNPTHINEIVSIENGLYDEFNNYENKFEKFLNEGYETEIISINKNLYNILNYLFTNWRIKHSTYYTNNYEDCKRDILICDRLFDKFLKD